MIIYCLRHGQTQWNKKRIMQGHKDSPLTLLGRKEAEKRGKALMGEGIEIIYSSDLGRCVETTNIINRRLKKQVIVVPQLREIDLGDFAGQSNDKNTIKDPDERCPNGESWNQLKRRALSFIQSLVGQGFDKILVVTHEGVLRMILSDYFQEYYLSETCDTFTNEIYVLKITDRGIEKGSLKKIVV